MDLNEYLAETVICNPESAPWGTLISQIIFDCFRKHCLELIQENELKPWTNIYELCENYIDEPFKKYLGEIFQVEHYEEYKNEDLCIAFLKKFEEMLKETLEKRDTNEEVLTDFLDTNIFLYFEKGLEEHKSYHIFPKNYELELDLEKYEELRKVLFEKKKELVSEELEEPIITKEEPTKSITKALLKKRLGIKQTRKHNIPTNTFVFARTHKNKSKK
jgi:hypothetical protein